MDQHATRTRHNPGVGITRFAASGMNRIIIDWQRTRVGVAHQSRPALEGVVDGLGRAAAIGHGQAGGDEPLLA